MNPIFGVAALIGLVALLASRRSSASSSAPALPAPDDDSDIPPHLRDLEPMIIPAPGSVPDAVTSPTPGVDSSTQADIENELDKERTKLPKKFPSPFPRVSDDAWTKYVMGQRTGKLNTITAGFALGIWGLGMRVLQDLGLAKNVKLQPMSVITTTGSETRQVFKGDFVPPLTQQRFLSDAPTQYEAFRRMTQAHAGYISKKYANLIANAGDVSLSGLLALAKHAGLAGMDKWMSDPSTRKESTSAQFKKFNGMF